MFLIFTVTTLLVLFEKGRAADYYYTGNGYPLYDENDGIAYLTNVGTLEKCKDKCNNHKGCETIMYANGHGWCYLFALKINAFAL